MVLFSTCQPLVRNTQLTPCGHDSLVEGTKATCSVEFDPCKPICPDNAVRRHVGSYVDTERRSVTPWVSFVSPALLSANDLEPQVLLAQSYQARWVNLR